MSYLTKPNSLDGVTDVATAARSVLEDPCLGKATELILTLNALEQPTPRPARPPRPGVKPPPAPPAVPIKGIGLCSAVGPLQKIVYLKRNKWVLPVVGASIFLGLFGLGYAAGRGRKRP